MPGPGRPFQKGHPKLGGCKKGLLTKHTLARQKAISESLEMLGLQPQAVDAIAPLAVMRMVMAARLKAGDHMGALAAAEAESEPGGYP